MRILNQDTGQSIRCLILYLTRAQASELRDKLEGLLDGPPDQHEHLSSEDYQKEVTVCIYDLNSLGHFDERSRRLILEDK